MNKKLFSLVKSIILIQKFFNIFSMKFCRYVSKWSLCFLNFKTDSCLNIIIKFDVRLNF